PSGHGDISIPFFAPNYWQRRELRGLIDPNPYFEGSAAAPKAAVQAPTPAWAHFWIGLYSMQLPLKTKLFILTFHILPKRVSLFIAHRDPNFLAKMDRVNQSIAAANAAPSKPPSAALAFFLNFWAEMRKPKPPLSAGKEILARLGGWLL